MYMYDGRLGSPEYMWVGCTYSICKGPEVASGESVLCDWRGAGNSLCANLKQGSYILLSIVRYFVNSQPIGSPDYKRQLNNLNMYVQLPLRMS